MSDRADRDFDALLERTSLGSVGARRLRDRTSRLRERSAMPPPRDPGRVDPGRADDASPGVVEPIGRTGAAVAPETGEAASRRTYLARLDQEERTALLSLGRPRKFAPRSVLLREGDPAENVLLLINGWTKETASTADGYVALTAVHGPGDIVGESAPLTDRPCFATITALEPVQAVVIEANTFRQFLGHRPQAALELLRTVTDRLRDTDRRRTEFTSLTVRERLASLLLDLADQYGRRTTGPGIEITIPLTQEELASAIGVSRGMLLRVIRELRDRGVVATGRHGIVIRRIDLLRGERQEGRRQSSGHCS